MEACVWKGELEILFYRKYFGFIIYLSKYRPRRFFVWEICFVEMGNLPMLVRLFSDSNVQLIVSLWLPTHLGPQGLWCSRLDLLNS